MSGGHRPLERKRKPLTNLLGSVVTVGPQRADDAQHVSGIDLVDPSSTTQNHITAGHRAQIAGSNICNVGYSVTIARVMAAVDVSDGTDAWPVTKACLRGHRRDSAVAVERADQAIRPTRSPPPGPDTSVLLAACRWRSTADV